MGKFEQKKKRKKKQPVGLIVLAVILLVIVVVGFVMFVLPQIEERVPSGDTTATTTATEAATETAVPTATETAGTSVLELEFPVSLADGKLEVESLFQFDGINPDAGNAEGKNIASILLKNTSEEYLTEAKLTVKLADGTERNFLVTDLPAGKSVMAFSVENQPLESGDVSMDVTCEATLDAAGTAVSEKVTAEVDGIQIKLTNTTDESLSEIVVYCRCPFGEEYFGGITYQYTVNNLPAGESATVDAVDCILGMAEVVRIAVNESE